MGGWMDGFEFEGERNIYEDDRQAGKYKQQ